MGGFCWADPKLSSKQQLGKDSFRFRTPQHADFLLCKHQKGPRFHKNRQMHLPKSWLAFFLNFLTRLRLKPGGRMWRRVVMLQLRALAFTVEDSMVLSIVQKAKRAAQSTTFKWRSGMLGRGFFSRRIFLLSGRVSRSFFRIFLSSQKTAIQCKAALSRFRSLQINHDSIWTSCIRNTGFSKFARLAFSGRRYRFVKRGLPSWHWIVSACDLSKLNLSDLTRCNLRIVSVSLSCRILKRSLTWMRVVSFGLCSHRTR